MRFLRHQFRRPRENYTPTIVDGIRFASKAEARYYVQLKTRKAAGDVVMFLRQVPLHIGVVRYVVDFVRFDADGTVHFVDVKGHKTDMYKMKKRMVEAEYPITIEEV